MSNVVPLLPARDRSGRSGPGPGGSRRPGKANVPALWRVALGQQLRSERQARQARISDIAGRAGVSPQYVSEIERGIKDPSSEILEALAGALELPVADLAGRAAHRMVAAPANTRTPQCLAA